MDQRSPGITGVMADGQTRAAALPSVQALALRTMANRLENDEAVPRNYSTFPSLRHEPLTFNTGFSRTLHTSSKRPTDQALHRVTSRPPTNRAGGCGLFLSRSREIGPRMLARLAKVTGLTPDDL
ncbi:MAG: hypothetical protein P0121_16340 [Nitrospira sp.]|nr:hypothetical protein [Nitrospira sp.]